MIKSINLAVHFFLELAAFAALFYSGFRLSSLWWSKALLGLVIPVLLMAAWGIFRVPGYPGNAPVPVPGILRLGLELGVFALAVVELYLYHNRWAAVLLAVLVVINYLVMYRDILTMLQYNPFTHRGS